MNSGKKYFVLCLFLAVMAVFMLNRSRSFLPDGSHCMSLESAEKSDCIRPQVDRFLEKGKVDHALTFLRKYQINDKNYYGTDCHGIAHYIGDKAYQIYKKGTKFNTGNDSGVCVYGFYHAFTSAFIANGEYEAVRSFCTGISSEKLQEITGCYHGMGHGAIYDFFEKYGIRDPLTLINKGVYLCKKIGLNDEGVLECVTGVYDGIGDEVLDPSYTGLTPRDIYGYCVSQPEEYKDKCYENISHLVFRKTLMGFEYLLNYALGNVESKHVASAVRGLATIYVVDLKGSDIRHGVGLCLPLKQDVKYGCIRGMVYKITADVEDSSQFETARDFCNLDVFTGDNRKLCAEISAEFLPGFYKHNELLDKCNSDLSFFGRTCKEKFI